MKKYNERKDILNDHGGLIRMSIVINREWLVKQLANEKVRVVDCRFELGNPNQGAQLYRESHIPGAVYFDLEKQLSGPVSQHGGRHPLPAIDTLKQEIEQVGIDQDVTVVAYDSGGGQFASRFWWLLTYIGHENVYILNEGFEGWQHATYPTTEEVPTFSPTTFDLNLNGEMLASYEEVKEIVDKQKPIPYLVDARDHRRYLGEIEPIDRIPGHIPGAINKCWVDGLDHGVFKSSEAQQERFADLDKDAPIIVYCGSGVTAAPNYIALKMAGFKHVKLYAGSYSDWISYPDNPVVKGKE